MLNEIMKHIRNYFPAGKYEEGEFVIENGTISLSFATDGQYVLIEGSTMNDGVYKVPLANLKNESFKGCISLLAPPKDFLDLAIEIESYQEKHSEVGPYINESFGGYSYTKATTVSGNIAGWQSAFKSRLDAWRKL